MLLLARFRPVHPRAFVTRLQVGSKSIGAVGILAYSGGMSLSESLKGCVHPERMRLTAHGLCERHRYGGVTMHV